MPKPQIEAEVNIATGEATISESPGDENAKFSINLNGGSPFVSVDSEYYIRVARIQCPVYPFG